MRPTQKIAQLFHPVYVAHVGQFYTPKLGRSVRILSYLNLLRSCRLSSGGSLWSGIK